MSEEERTSSGPPRARPLRPAEILIGMLALGATTIVASIVAPIGFDPYTGVIYLLLVAGLALIAFRLRWRGFALGLIGGFVLLTVVSGGACTFFAPPGEAELVGLMLYLLALIIGGIVVSIDEIRRVRR